MPIQNEYERKAKGGDVEFSSNPWSMITKSLKSFPSGNRIYNFWSKHFWHNKSSFGLQWPATQSPPYFSPEFVCPRNPRLRAIWKGYKNLPRIGYVPVYPHLGMGEPWVTQYGACCGLPFFVYYFSAKGKNG